MATVNLDKRQYPRFNTVVSLQYSALTKYNYLTKIKRSLTQNISEGGISFSTGDYIRELSPLNLLISLHDSPLKAEGQVVWTRKLKNRKIETYQEGVKFTNIDPYSRAKIAKLEWS